MDIYGDHLLYCEGGSHRIRRHDAQVRISANGLVKAAWHPTVEEGPLERHGGSLDIFVFGRSHPHSVCDLLSVLIEAGLREDNDILSRSCTVYDFEF